ncbi:MAG: retention module-containing protein, partial [Gammaproteobacteria bacterium]|nr:retention module-containing protein [Gammaproteobacteria bacterium]MBU1416771.1 retention module-containing protein [Gammaproteobacteria bacterium]
MANAVGKVALLEGQAFARSEDGSQRALKVGDAIMEGEVIVTGPDSRVELAFDNGTTYLVRETETVTIDNTVFGTDLPESHDAALIDRISETAAITRAIAEGSSLDDLLEETAAGFEGGGGEEGHDFVQLLRIVEAVPPLAYDYGTGRGYVAPALADAAKPVELPPNPDAPQATNDGVFAATEDTPRTITPDQLLGNDSDPNGDALTIVSVHGATHGTVALVGGNIVFTPAANYNGTASFTYTISDGTGNTDTASVTLNVAPVNDTPVAQNDTATTAEDTPVTIVVRGNDSDVDGDSLTVSAVTNGAHGTVAIDPVSGNPVYTPAANWSGTDTFTYTVSDGNGGTSTATVNVTVTAVNDPPAANPDSASTAEETPVTVSVLSNDTDADGNPLSVTAASVPAAQGAVVVNADNTVTFTPATDFNGDAMISYSISDGQGGTASSTVTVTVTPVNDGPIANPDTATTAEDTPVTFSVLSNDTDADGNPLTVTAASVPATQGTVVVNADNTITFTPAADFNGDATISYSISDGQGGTAISTMTVTVTSVNDVPVAQNDTATTAEDTPVTIAVRGNDSDLDGDLLTVSAVTNGAHGTVAIDPVSGNPIYTPAANYNGPDSFTYTVSDGNGGTATAIVNVTVGAVNDAPVTGHDLTSTAINAPVTVAVLSNDSDVDGDSLTVSAVTNGAHGTVAIDSVSGNPVYTPATDWSGTDTFTYTVNDGHGGTSTATVTVNVGANTPPTGTDATFTLAEDGSRSFAAGDFGFADADLGQTFQAVRIDNPPALGVLTYLGNPVTVGQIIPASGLGSLVFTPAADGNGNPYASFTFSVQDSGGAFDVAPNTIILNVTPVNDAPVAVDDNLLASEDTPAIYTAAQLLGNDTDADGNPLTIASVV